MVFVLSLLSHSSHNLSFFRVLLQKYRPVSIIKECADRRSLHSEGYKYAGSISKYCSYPKLALLKLYEFKTLIFSFFYLHFSIDIHVNIYILCT